MVCLKRVLCSLLIALWVLLCARWSHGADFDPTKTTIAKLGTKQIESEWLPTRDGRRVGDYWLATDGQKRSARWTLEVLDRNSLTKAVERAAGFKADPDVAPEFQAVDADYKSPFRPLDRGHLAAADNHKTSNVIQAATFLLSNTAPQASRCNQGCWRMLEAYVQKRAQDADGVIVVTAPAYRPNNEGRIVIDVIGRNQVWVPTHFAKAILMQLGDELFVEAWIVPNDDLETTDFTLFACGVDEFERVVGVDVFAPLEDSVERRLEKAFPLKVVPK